jgi:hypothetical protein
MLVGSGGERPLGLPRIAQQIALAFGIPLNKDVVDWQFATDRVLLEAWNVCLRQPGESCGNGTHNPQIVLVHVREHFLGNFDGRAGGCGPVADVAR